MSALPRLCSVIGVGARTPLGLNACQTGMLLRAGFATMAPAPLGPEDEDITICHQPALPSSLLGAERVIELAEPPLGELLESLTAYPRELRTRFLLALDAEQTEPDVVAARLLDRCRRRFGDTRLEVAARGEGGASLLIQKAVSALDKNLCDLVILGGVHSDHDKPRIARLLAEERLYSDDNLDAVMPGESAAFIALTKTPRDRADVTAHICAVGNAVDEARPDNDVPTAPARGATAAMRQATAPLEASQVRAGWLLTDMAFETWRTREAQTVFTRATPILGDPYRFDFPAQRIGALGAAAIPLCIALVSEGFERECAPSSIALVLAGSDTGERGAVLLTKS